MTILGCDHSTAGAIIGSTLKRQGYAGIVRYAAGGRTDVNITRAEVNDLKAHGIATAIVLEHSATWLENTSLVAEEVRASRQVCRVAGLPDGVIYMAADFDVTNGGPTAPGSKGEENMKAVLASLEVAAKEIGRENVGFYGSAYAIDWLVVHAPWIKFYWNTEAWSHNRPVHPRACLYQRAASARIDGVSCDLDVILKPNFGQRVSVPKPPPKPAPKPNRYPHIPSRLFPLRRRAYNLGWQDRDAWGRHHS